MKTRVIEKEGQFYKECMVVMLDTDTPSKLGFLTQKGKDVFNDLRWFKGHELPKILDSVNQHLYITSDDEIKEGDWVIFRGGKPFRCGSDEHAGLGFLKIIATTDTSLGLPQPSDKFIQAYIEAYNKGEKIDKVLVEYEKKWEYHDGPHPTIKDVQMWRELVGYPKLKDNNIIIKKVKDSWTRDEVINIYKQGAKDYCNSSQHIEKFFSKDGDGTKFINKNL